MRRLGHKRARRPFGRHSRSRHPTYHDHLAQLTGEDRRRKAKVRKFKFLARTMDFSGRYTSFLAECAGRAPDLLLHASATGIGTRTRRPSGPISFTFPAVSGSKAEQLESRLVAPRIPFPSSIAPPTLFPIASCGLSSLFILLMPLYEAPSHT
jgi:hypothetical protein